jgi:hypothetical protein
MNPAMTRDLAWLQGAPRRVFMAGGSDAHGDLNFRREGMITGWSSSNDTAIGKPRNLLYVGDARPTAVIGGSAIGQTQVVDAFRTGNFSVTDGPALRIAIDRNRNGFIDKADTPMGGVANVNTVPLIVEWKSTPEFGPVTSIDIYVGSQAGTAEGITWAPSAHGARPSGKPTGTLTEDIPDATTGRVYKQLDDNYFLDGSGKLRIEMLHGEGHGGRRKVVLSRADYPVVEKECHVETTSEPPRCWTDAAGRKHCSKPVLTDDTICTASRVTPAERIYVRAFARTKSSARVGSSRVELQRFAYTNPIWVRPNTASNVDIDATEGAGNAQQ